MRLEETETIDLLRDLVDRGLVVSIYIEQRTKVEKGWLMMERECGDRAKKALLEGRVC